MKLWFGTKVTFRTGEESREHGDAERTRDPEIIFALTSPVGTPVESVRSILAGGLIAYGYTVETVKLSRLLLDQAQLRNIPVRDAPEHHRISDLINVGDILCEEAVSSAAVVLHGVAEIREMRAQYHSKMSAAAYGELEYDKGVPRRAWLIESLKRPAEVKQLRQIYGDHLFVIGVQASLSTRKRLLGEHIRPYMASKNETEVELLVNALVNRDFDERDRGVHGQSILKTFPLADIFVDVDESVSDQINKLLDLLFGNPVYPVPSDDEFGMYLAAASSSRSPELGLKVGAAIMNEGAVVSLGANTHPTDALASPFYDRSALDIRQLILDTLRHLPEMALKDVAQRQLREDPDAFIKVLLEGDFAFARINHLTEFQLTVHAEMAAILDAVSHGKCIANATVFVTAYPCHGCAKHLLRLDLPVRYVEPYPKSRAEAMYGQIAMANFRPFTGIAPSRFQQLFNVTEDRKGPEGVRKTWTVAEKVAAEPKVNPLIDQAGIALREAVAISRLPTTSVDTDEGDERGTVGASDQDGDTQQPNPGHA